MPTLETVTFGISRIRSVELSTFCSTPVTFPKLKLAGLTLSKRVAAFTVSAALLLVALS